jgi:hypothetical protein
LVEVKDDITFDRAAMGRLGSVLNRDSQLRANHDSSFQKDGGLDVRAFLAE